MKIKQLFQRSVNEVKKATNASVTPEEVHDDFLSAPAIINGMINDMLLQCQIPTQEESYAQKMRAAGFLRNPLVEKVQTIAELKEKAEYLRTILDNYSIKFPQYKFITKDVLDRICRKYGLHYASIDFYIKNIPQKNLDLILNINIPENERMWEYSGRAGRYSCTFNECHNVDSYASRNRNGVKPLIIVAPRDHFHKDLEESGYELVARTQDPIIICEVPNGYLIITAWDKEASDEDIVNHKMN